MMDDGFYFYSKTKKDGSFVGILIGPEGAIHSWVGSTTEEDVEDAFEFRRSWLLDAKQDK